MKINEQRQQIYNEIEQQIVYLPDEQRKHLQECMEKLKCIDVNEHDVLKELLAIKLDKQDAVTYYFNLLDALKELYEVE